MDWFKGKFTGKPHIYWENLWFPVNFPIIQFYALQIGDQIWQHLSTTGMICTKKGADMEPTKQTAEKKIPGKKQCRLPKLQKAGVSWCVC